MTTGTLISAIVLAGSLSLGQAQSINIENKSSYIGNERWEWTLYATGDSKVINDIRCIEYKLHPTFPNPIQTVCRQGEAETPFALNGSGWGEFNVVATVKLSGGRTVKINHWLKLAS